jgi:hypothetical protein
MIYLKSNLIERNTNPPGLKRSQGRSIYGGADQFCGRAIKVHWLSSRVITKVSMHYPARNAKPGGVAEQSPGPHGYIVTGRPPSRRRTSHHHV